MHNLVCPDRLAPGLVEVTGDERGGTPEVQLIAYGKSSLTFVLHSAAGELILRHTPNGGPAAERAPHGPQGQVPAPPGGHRVSAPPWPAR